jgi:double-stranded uracil-DNA glycosylase
MKRHNIPTHQQLLAARARLVPDILAPDLQVLFCGINPGLYSAATGHHFARPGNRFWPALHASGFTPRLFTPGEDSQLPSLGLGITNVVHRASASADELTGDEFVRGGEQIAKTVLQYRPEWLAVLGIGAYKQAFGVRQANIGPQDKTIGATKIWLLPNPSGLNAHYSSAQFAEAFAALRRAL